ncbi:protein NRT1/ PTR FAMILY 4.5-like [Hibiscus syriacus]|uniref:protein NRT1/ PTR FAMILY 4.5-like n=1 Tax=Hibiscus syriacus TaxID=106335 RepID=UPI001923BB6B|nr:protein NRT1/ PTR FAMILY 4.5-like [Hibiscus syriacus]
MSSRFFNLQGLALITIQAYYKDLQPAFCFGKPSCIHGGKAVMFYTSLGLLALGSGGVKGALPALGGEQFDHKDPKEAKALARFFNWLLLSTTLGASVGVTGIVYLTTEKHKWFWGFFISTVATFIGFCVLASGKPFYRLREPTAANSPIIRIAQVIAVAFKNRRLALPDKPDELYEVDEDETSCREESISHTNQFRFLDKAAIVPKEPEATPSPWTVCTVTQVEEVKILTRMLPILGSTIIMNTSLAQLQTFSVEQGNIMDRHLGQLNVPAASIPIIPLVFMSILIPVYELFFVPFARKITHHPSGITQLQRVGVGLVLSAISMAVAGIVEVKRRDQAHKNMFKPISLFWLSFQYGIFGIADMFTLVGLLEFFYKEAPIGMRSLSTSFTWLSLSFGYFLSTVFVNIINSITKRVGSSGKGWIHGLDLNQSNLNLFYWFLAILSCLNFINYLYWASWYKYKTGEPDPDEAEAKDLRNGPLVAEGENTTLDGGVSQTHEAPSSVQTEESTQQLIKELDHPEAEAKDLSTGPLVKEEENTLDGGLTQTQEAPSSVQTEESKQQLIKELDHPEAEAKDLSSGPLVKGEENTLDGGLTQTQEAPSVQTEESKQ